MNEGRTGCEVGGVFRLLGSYIITMDSGCDVKLDTLEGLSSSSSSYLSLPLC